MKLQLPNVTLLGIDCVDADRLIRAIDISCEGIDFGSVKILSSLPFADPRRVEILPIGSIEEYSLFCIRDLHRYVDTDYVLIVQYDGFVLNPTSWSDEFLKYDYIGAPWYIDREFWFNLFKFPRSLKNMWVVGNGGFSLRSKKFIEKSAELYHKGLLTKTHPEDLVMCVWNKKIFENEGLAFASADVAKKFSIESDNAIYEAQFGFHGFKWTNIDRWFALQANNYPEVEKAYRIEYLTHVLRHEKFAKIYTWNDMPNFAYSLHAHKGRVTLCIVEGSVMFSGGFEKTLVKGDRFDVPVGVEHTAIVGPDGCTYVVGEEIEGDS